MLWDSATRDAGEARARHHRRPAAEWIERHWDGIAVRCRAENRVSLGFIEGLNYKIRVVQRRACFRVVDADKSVLEVADYYMATSQLAQTRLRSVLGQHELDEILAKRDAINQVLQETLDQATDPWGIKISEVEIKDVDINETMVRAIARQAEAERDRRAKIIHAEGEFQAAEKLRDAAATLAQQSQALQLRYLQTLADMAASGKASTVVFPLPLDLIKPLFPKLGIGNNDDKPEAPPV